jgi:ATP-dependent Clp protease adaptor protein ClpS
MIHLSDDDTVVEKAKPKLKRPKLYKVVLLNDDYTPMEFVVHILKVFFNMDEDKATNIMLQVHHDGKGICGAYSRDIAETKVVQINTYARENEHPLMSVMEEL